MCYFLLKKNKNILKKKLKKKKEIEKEEKGSWPPWLATTPLGIACEPTPWTRG
jgi:hypothetical protein